MNRNKLILASLLVSLLISHANNVHAQEDLPVVHAVLFYSPTCGHCEYVIQNFLPQVMEKYGEQLQIVGVDVTQQQGQALFLSAMEKFKLEQAGVPFLVIDDQYLAGSTDIPDKFPGLVDEYLSRGGVEWPDIPGLADLLGTPGSIPRPSPTPVPVVRAVLFYRSTCSHCQEVTEQVIPPLFEKYGAQLEIFGVDVSGKEGLALFRTAIERFKIENFGVPTLIVGDQVLFGGIEILEKVNGVIEGYLSQGGVSWPDIPRLDEAISRAAVDSASTAAAATQPSISRSTPPVTLSPASSTAAPGLLLMENKPSRWQDRFLQDPTGNTLSVLVLIAMLGALSWTIYLLTRGKDRSFLQSWEWIIPYLCMFGMGVAGYLAFVETTQATAVCGPVGDCNTVQQSEYARLFGILPIGVLGLTGYAAVLLLWLAARYTGGRLQNLAAILLLVLTVFGTLFSFYLTFLEPFVIGATCIWCITSAVLMTVLMLLSAGRARSILLSQQAPAYSHGRLSR